VVSVTFGRSTGVPNRVGQPLHQRVVHHHAAVDAQLVDLRAVAAHRVDEVARLVADRIERGRRDLGRSGIASEAQQRAARTGVQ